MIVLKYKIIIKYDYFVRNVKEKLEVDKNDSKKIIMGVILISKLREGELSGNRDVMGIKRNVLGDI